MRNNLFEPVVAAFLANGPRYNLLNSSVLELFEFVRKENMKPLVAHIVEAFYEPKLATCDYVDTFRALKLKYEQNKVRRTSLLVAVVHQSCIRGCMLHHKLQVEVFWL